MKEEAIKKEYRDVDKGDREVTNGQARGGRNEADRDRGEMFCAVAGGGRSGRRKVCGRITKIE